MIRLPVRANAISYFKVADNDDPEGYEEFGADWFTSSGTAYGASSRCAWIQGNAPYADFTKTLNYSGIYDVEFIVPVTANAHDHAVYRILVDGSVLATVIKDQNQGSGQFVSLGEYPLPGDVPITVRVQDFGGNTNPGSNIVLRADAVRFRRLPEKHVMLDHDSLNFGEVSIEDTTFRYITVSNLTSGDLNILTMAPSGDHLTVDAGFPLALAPWKPGKSRLLSFPGTISNTVIRCLSTPMIPFSQPYPYRYTPLRCPISKWPTMMIRRGTKNPVRSGSASIRPVTAPAAAVPGPVAMGFMQISPKFLNTTAFTIFGISCRRRGTLMIMRNILSG